MPRLTTAAARTAYAAAALVRERCLLDTAGLGDPPGRTWTRPLLRHLDQRLDAAAAGAGRFTERLRSALDDAPGPERRLAAEVVAVHVIAGSDLRPERRRALVHICDPEILLHPEVLAALDGAGVAPLGTAAAFTRLTQLRIVTGTALAVRAVPSARRQAVVTDPWAFADLVHTVPVAGGHAQRAALRHLLHPATFEAIWSRDLMTRIARGTGAERDHDIDRHILAVRRALTATHGRGFSFLDADVAPAWDPSSTAS